MARMMKYYIPDNNHYIKKEINIPGVPPTTQYVFPLFPQIERVLANEELMDDAMWKPEIKLRNGERVYGECNTGKLFEAHYNRVQASVDPADPDRHLHAPLILELFDDSTLCSNLGRLTSQPIIASVYNIKHLLSSTRKVCAL